MHHPGNGLLHEADAGCKPSYRRFLANSLFGVGVGSVGGVGGVGSVGGVRDGENYWVATLYPLPSNLKVTKKAIKIGIAVYIIIGNSIGKFIGGAFITPTPPSGTTFTVIKFLPLAFAIFEQDGRTAIDPGGGGGGRAGATIRATKFLGVSC